MPHSDINSSKSVTPNKLYIASMYFFIPLNGLASEYRQAFKDARHPINAPAYIQATDFSCNYLKLENKAQIFYFNSRSWDFQECIQRKIILTPHIFHYNPNKTSSNSLYFLVIETVVDKTFAKKPACVKNFCTANDLVCLIKGLYECDRKGPSFPATDPYLYHRTWLESLVSRIEGKKISAKRRAGISFRNAITELITVDIENLNIDLYEKQFADKYYQSGNDNPESSIITEYYRRLCYGILSGNDNYINIHTEALGSLLGKGYSNNYTEATYALPTSIVFIKKHYPFKAHSDTDIEERIKPTKLENIQYIHEMCGALYMKMQFKKARKLYYSGRSSKIKEALFKLAGMMGTKQFRVMEADKRAEYIFNSLGIKEEYEQIKDRGNLLADSINIKYSTRINLGVAILTVMTVLIGLTQIFQNINSKDMICHCNPCKHSTFTEVCSYETIILLLILICLIIITCFTGYHVFKKRKNTEEDF